MTAHMRTEEVLYESEAALRLVDQEILELRGSVRTDPYVSAIPGHEVPANLELATQQVLKILAHLRETRSTLQNSASVNLQSTHQTIREVNSVAEDAAINIMDACDRANVLVDALDALDEAASPNRDRARAVRAELRDELFHMMGALQFQDIMAQQLNFSSAVLLDVESRLQEVAQHLDANGIFERGVLRPATGSATTRSDVHYDPNATTRESDIRQALADEIFTNIKTPAA